MLGLLIISVGIGGFCALLYKAAVYAVPVAVGLWAGFAALHLDSGALIAFAVGVVVGAIVFGLGQSVWNSQLPKGLRYAVAVLFVGPAVWTSYCAIQQLAVVFVPGAVWQIAAAIVGAVSVGATAFLRLTGVDVEALNDGSENFIR